ncbi:MULTISPECIES: SRPBCC domain-containing protein [unclassified Mesorhizobium]|uniref:SRPBCC family protein n=3 Tax=Mesorhizobium TaxID=68287 RepID=UPI001093F29B|nr:MULTISPECIES: SRPBCC domain-containing protein [unclassified Mesorhizobium]TGV52679.1 SRPBCC domain-containing protein [bacterium M00.F.Ca.ET.141.01.1.1]TGQ80976.1 SRPBCC domain-containing protein [Mesorhizobium sp. M8A.F.Ca.ET.207.01.1.1]TGS36966.1 SRPBCC domain-containing protein [Mesorhizobium sp. M8A.F.Ca.ET.182.01.1.1]TGS75548.1 SRPBCC domain-containing protein [Mesorhizobium sp. M8A.F.Ca.ET.181.01.1.1]TGT35275.1 SRPBCC domain-containing protein [Mesorhizobium sp. M8A.F.Ca.ET.165.01.1.
MNFDIRARVSLLINANPQVVFDAWVDPPAMEQWLFKSPTNILRAVTNPQPGGTYSIIEHDGDSVITHDGIYSVVDRPARLAFSLVVPQHFEGTAFIEILIASEGTQSRLDFLAAGDGPEDAQNLWNRMLANLVELLNRK